MPTKKVGYHIWERRKLTSDMMAAPNATIPQIYPIVNQRYPCSLVSLQQDWYRRHEWRAQVMTLADPVDLVAKIRDAGNRAYAIYLQNTKDGMNAKNFNTALGGLKLYVTCLIEERNITMPDKSKPFAGFENQTINVLTSNKTVVVNGTTKEFSPDDALRLFNSELAKIAEYSISSACDEQQVDSTEPPPA